MASGSKCRFLRVAGCVLFEDLHGVKFEWLKGLCGWKDSEFRGLALRIQSFKLRLQTVRLVGIGGVRSRS